MDDLHLSVAKKDDWQLLQRLNHQIFVLNPSFDPNISPDWEYAKFGEEYFQKICSDPSIYALIATLNGNHVGYLNGFIKTIPYRKSRQIIGEIENLGVIPEYQRLGIATSLFKKFRGWAYQNKATSIVASAFASNQNALDFYHHLGFTTSEIQLELKVK